MNPDTLTKSQSLCQASSPSLTRRLVRWAAPWCAALGLLTPQLKAGALYLDFATDTGATTTGWTRVTQTNATGASGINVTSGGTTYNFKFPSVNSYGNSASQTLTGSGFYNNNYTVGKTFTLTGLIPLKPVKLYACAAWDAGNGAYLVYGDTGAGGKRAVTVGNPGTTGTLANLTPIGTATADGSGVVTGTMWGRNGVPGTLEGQVGAFVFLPTQTITASAGPNGSISDPGASDVFAGDSKAYTITPDSGYHVADVLVNGVSVGAVENYTITNINANIPIAASFAINATAHTITASAGSNGSISPAGAVSVFEHTNKLFSITPALGYHIADVLVDGASVGAVASYLFTDITAAHTISASFAIDTFAVTATAGANGSITPAGVTQVNYGANQSYTITASPGYYISAVLMDGVPVGAGTSYTFTNVTATHTISATFDNRTRLYLDFAKSGTGTTSGWTAVNDSGGNASVSNIGGLGYGFTFTNVANWDNNVASQPLTRSGFYNNGSTSVQHPFTVTGLVAGQSVSLYACAAWDGNNSGAYIVYGNSGVNGVKAQTLGDPGTNPTLANLTPIGTATADANGQVTGNIYGSNGVLGTNQGQVGGFVFVLDAPPSWTITASAGSNGSISPSGATTVNSGSNQTFTITPDSGYHVADVLVDGATVGSVGTYTFNTVTANHTISATFAQDTVTYTINASAGPNGTISPSGAVSVNQASSQVFTITPATGYHISELLVDGVLIEPAVTSYTFSNISASHSISASFAIDTFTITSSAGAHGAISPNGSATVNYGDSPTYTLTPAPGYYVDSLQIDGIQVSPSTSHTFTNVTASHTISATFDNRVKIKLDFTQNGDLNYTSGWTPAYAALQADTMVSVSNIGGLGYGFTCDHVAVWNTGNALQPLTRAGFYTIGNNPVPSARPFALTGLPPGQSVTLYACSAWDGVGAGAFIVYGNSGAAGKKAQTIDNPGTMPTLANFTEIGTAVADESGTVAGTLHGSGGVGTPSEGQVGGVITQLGQTPAMQIAGTAVSALYGRRQNYQASGITYRVKFSADMANWFDSTDTTNLKYAGTPDLEHPVVVATQGDMDAVSIPFPLFIKTAYGYEKTKSFMMIEVTTH